MRAQPAGADGEAGQDHRHGRRLSRAGRAVRRPRRGVDQAAERGQAGCPGRGAAPVPPRRVPVRDDGGQRLHAVPGRARAPAPGDEQQEGPGGYRVDLRPQLTGKPGGQGGRHRYRRLMRHDARVPVHARSPGNHLRGAGAVPLGDPLRPPGRVRGGERDRRRSLACHAGAAARPRRRGIRGGRGDGHARHVARDVPAAPALGQVLVVDAAVRLRPAEPEAARLAHRRADRAGHHAAGDALGRHLVGHRLPAAAVSSRGRAGLRRRLRRDPARPVRALPGRAPRDVLAAEDAVSVRRHRGRGAAQPAAAHADPLLRPGPAARQPLADEDGQGECRHRVKRAARITIAAGLALIVLAVAGRLILGAYAPKPAKPAAGGYLGVAEAGETASYQPVEDFATAVGRKPNIVLYYSSWSEAFNTRFARQVHAHGAMPFVQIDPGHTSLATVASGRDDAFIRSYARQVRAYGHPVIIGFAAEMNGDWDPWGYRHTPARTFVAAWRHLVTVFRQQGAGNVIWLWTVNVTDARTGPVH